MSTQISQDSVKVVHVTMLAKRIETRIEADAFVLVPESELLALGNDKDAQATLATVVHHFDDRLGAVRGSPE